MHKEERIQVIQKFGFTSREAEFLCLVALHGGYFLRRQYDRFLGGSPSGTGDRLFEKGLKSRLFRMIATENRMRVYRLASRRFFDAIGEPDNRNRRLRSASAMLVKLMVLDYVLDHPQYQYLATEGEKTAYIADVLGVDRRYLPGRAYHSKDRRTTTSRYFVDKFPLHISGALHAPSTVVHFCYVDGAIGRPTGFDTYLLQYRHLFRQLKASRVVYVSTDSRMFAQAEKIFSRLVSREPETGRPPIEADLVPLVEHFRARELWEQRRLGNFGKDELDRLRDGLQEFKATRFQKLYGAWKELLTSA